MANQFSAGSEWPADKLARLEKLVGDGTTRKDTGEIMGITKNAVVGKVNRMGFRPRPDAVLSTQQIGRIRAAVHYPTLMERLDKVDLFPSPGCCVFPLPQEPVRVTHFCGGDVVDGKPYCGPHEALTRLRGS